MSFIGNEEQIRFLQERFKFIYAVLFIGVGILLARMTYLQVINGEQMRQYSEENRIKRVKIPAPRGMVFDRFGKLLVDNRPAFDVQITPQYLKESGKPKEVIEKLSKLIDTPVAEIEKKLLKARTQPAFMPVLIKDNLNRDEVAELETWKLDLPGVQVEMAISRTNTAKDVGTHLYGYIGRVSQTELPILNSTSVRKYDLNDSIGKSGLEKQFEDTLRGVDGSELVEVDALGRSIQSSKNKGRVLIQNQEEPFVPGKNLILSVDQDLQQAAVRGFGDKTGGLIALDPRNGEVLAMVSRPSFDPSEFSRGIDPELWAKLLADENHPLRDKTIQDHYSPGSTFKTITAIAGLEEGVITKDTTFNCSGSITVGNRVVHCWKKGGHGNMNVVSALTQSCDVFFYRVAQKLKSVDDIAKYAFHLGLGAKTGIELAREVPGLIPTEAWKQQRFNVPWSPGETLYVAIGQSFVLTTTIQLANAYASLVNGGTLFKPHVVKGIQNEDGKVIKEFVPQILDKTKLSKSTVELVTEGLWGVVNSPTGSAHGNAIPGMEFAGKTGTVQVIQARADKVYQKCENLRYNQRHHGVFVGYAPIKDPSIVVAVVAEHACSGSHGAAPIAREVIKTYLQKYYPDMYSDKAIAERLAAEKASGRAVKVRAPAPAAGGPEE
ncbi:MAG: penicillin-binding protein 2 [Bdellovibrionales bacterium]|nr:penicillin-binding protein 2 [Bdellovibrionales bacterium]